MKSRRSKVTHPRSACDPVRRFGEKRNEGVRVLSRLAERLRGLKCLSGEEGCAVLVPCCDIHTFGMGGPIDVAFVDAAGAVLAVHRRVMPGRRIRHAEARLVVERPSQSGRWFERGDALFNVPSKVDAPPLRGQAAKQDSPQAKQSEAVKEGGFA